MKIGYLANVRFPSERAHATQIACTAQAFCENGAIVELFVNTRSNVSKGEVDEYFKINSKFLLYRLPYGVFLPKIRPAFYFSEVFFSLSFLLKFGTKNHDIFYSRSEWIVWCLSFFIPSDKLVWESHEAKLNYPARKILKSEALVIVISEGIFEAYREFGVDGNKMVVAHDGIDESFFGLVATKAEARKKLDLPNEEKIVMYIGGFDEWKGVETFFAASNVCKEILFVAIGGSDFEISTYSKKYPLVKFLGQKPYFDLKDNQQAADVLVIPNSNKVKLSSHYTSPLKLFAHMASGVPLVVSDIPSIRRMTGDAQVTLVKPDSPEALAQGIRSVCNLIADKIMLAQQMVNRARTYTWNERANRILSKIHVAK
jgi:glycosyltransferase involved in cell wall biosynthesis